MSCCLVLISINTLLRLSKNVVVKVPLSNIKSFLYPSVTINKKQLTHIVTSINKGLLNIKKLLARAKILTCYFSYYGEVFEFNIKELTHR